MLHTLIIRFLYFHLWSFSLYAITYARPVKLTLVTAERISLGLNPERWTFEPLIQKPFRVFHWGVILNIFFTYLGSDPFLIRIPVHIYSGLTEEIIHYSFIVIRKLSGGKYEGRTNSNHLKSSWRWFLGNLPWGIWCQRAGWNRWRGKRKS